MKRARVVIGGAFGDEGKGLMTDYFVRQVDDAPMVVRFSGGAQAGHTVVEPDGRRHVFHHFGSGSLAGAPTYLGRRFTVNPILWRREREELARLDLGPDVMTLRVDRDARVSTIYDMVYNQVLELSRGDARHGSCGVGINETFRRSLVPGLRLLACDLDNVATVKHHVLKIRAHYRRLLESDGLWTDEARRIFGEDEVFDEFVDDCSEMAESVLVTDIRTLSRHSLVFEGAQGLLLDSECSRFFPHVTRSRTGIVGAVEIADDIGLDQLDVSYVLRTYLTRHGAGPLPMERTDVTFPDDTNVENAWQGRLRFALMSRDVVFPEINKDIAQSCGTGAVVVPSLAITHMDQHSHDFSEWPLEVAHEAWGRTHEHVSRTSRGRMYEDSIEGGTAGVDAGSPGVLPA